MYLEGRFLVYMLVPVVILSGALLAFEARAEGIKFNGQFGYRSTDSKTTVKSTGEKTKSDSFVFDQQYNLNVSKRIYPYLRFSTGAFFELIDTSSTVEGEDTDTEERILRPFVELNLDNPIYVAGITYRRTDRRLDTSEAPVTEFSTDQFDSILRWRPIELPELTLRYNRVHNRDDPKTVDIIDTLLSFKATYSAWEKLRLDYLYTREETKDRITNFDPLEQTHFGRADYFDSFFDNRLSLNTTYRIRHNTLEARGGGSAESALQRAAGLSSLDNTPQDGPALEVNNALIDGNVTASAGLNLGLNGDETILTNIGLDFGSAVDVDTIHLWVDQLLTSAVANSFSWSVYTSPDNTDTSTWTLLTTVFPAPFGAFDNRFEISFPEVNTRFIKVVTRPLSPAVPGASSFPNIFVTEMQAFVTLTGTDKVTNVDQDFVFTLRGRPSDRTNIGYNLSYVSREQDPSTQERTLLTNDFFLNHIFNKVFSTGGRFSLTDRNTTDSNSDIYEYSAFLRGAYLSTLDQRLAYSGRYEDDNEEGYEYENAIVLRTNAKLYRGWDAFLDTGYDWKMDTDDVRRTSIFARAGTNIVPNEKITLNLTYQIADVMKPEDSTTSEFNLQVFFIPFRALSLSATITYVDSETSSRTFQNYVLNWSPFPDGALQFLFNYTETLRSEQDQRETTIGPGLSWTIHKHFFLETSYSFTRTESNIQKTDSDNFLATLRYNF